MKSEYQWTALTMVGFVAGLVLSLTAGVPIFAVLGAMAGTPIVVGLVGAGVGLAQWIVLRRQIAGCARWIAANAWSLGAGLAGGSLLADATGRRAGSLLSTSILLLVGTAVAGLWTARVLSQIMTSASQPSRAQ